MLRSVLRICVAAMLPCESLEVEQHHPDSNCLLRRGAVPVRCRATACNIPTWC